MSCWALIPIKAADSKSRLAGVLDQEARQALVDSMLEHVLMAASGAQTIDRVALVGPARPGLPEDLTVLSDPGTGLNPAVQSAFGAVGAHAPSRVLVIAADLPFVTPQDLDLLAMAPADKLAIAPDRHGTGTNALSLPLPRAAGFRFAFGPDSCAKHCLEAERLGLGVEMVLSHGLEKDIDEPSDLPDAQHILKQSR